MTWLGVFFARLRKDQKGATMIEYSILIGIITVLAIVSIALMGDYVASQWAQLVSLHWCGLIPQPDLIGSDAPLGRGIGEICERIRAVEPVHAAVCELDCSLHWAIRLSPMVAAHQGSAQMKVRPLIVLALALMCALLAVFLARSWILGQSSRPTAEAAQAQTVQVVAAATSLKFGDRLAKENLRLIDWPSGSVPEGTFRSIDELLGPEPRVALQAIQPNEPILINKVTGPGQRASLSAVITSGMRAMTIRVNDVLGVAGFVLPGDRVDIMLTREVVKDQPVTHVLLQNVKVLGIDQRSEQQNNKPDVVKAVTIEVTTEQTQKITLAAQVGTTVAGAARREQRRARAGQARLDQGSGHLGGDRHRRAETGGQEERNAGGEDRAEAAGGCAA